VRHDAPSDSDAVLWRSPLLAREPDIVKLLLKVNAR